MLKSLISQVLGDYSDAANEKPGSIAQVTEVPFKLAALFTELALNHTPLPKGLINFLTGTPKPGEAPVGGLFAIGIALCCFRAGIGTHFNNTRKRTTSGLKQDLNGGYPYRKILKIINKGIMSLGLKEVLSTNTDFVSKKAIH